MESGLPLEGEFEPDSSKVRAAWVRLQVIPLGDGIAVTARDVTERHRLEEELRHSQRMEAVGRLAGGVAHDFNNLLTAINGYGELLLSRVPEGDAMRVDVQEICSAGERAAALTQQLLAFSRRQMLKPEPLDLNAVVAEMDKMLRRLIGEHIDVETRLAPDLCLVHADRGQLEQVVMNLVVNARDAMESGGTLTLETANVGADARGARREPGAPPGRHAMLLVRDTGCGMDEETLAHVFEPFFTTKPSGKGTGLGLSMVYGIVQQSGGQIVARSKPGEGSTFRLFLPLAPPVAAAVVVAAPEVAAAGGRETVLLVEDEALVARLAERVLRDAGYTVLRAGDGIEAEQVFRRHAGAIDLLVSDVVMPHLGGPELAERLRTARTDLPVLFLSGYNDSAVLGRGLLRRDTSFLGKPFNPAALAAEVRRLLDQRAR
jgi:signal transduction histidine kinase/CheY-like chemotaxis protein